MFSLKRNKTLLLGIIVLFLFSPLSVYSVTYEDTRRMENVKPQAAGTLKIISRHATELLNDFKVAFLASSYAADVGYSPSDTDKIDFLQITTLTGWQKALGSTSAAVDLAWGGGPTLFNSMVDAGVIQPYSQSMKDFIASLNIPNELAGVPMNRTETNGDLMWLANAISSFGFTVNHDKLDEWGIAKPTTWEELASTDLFIDESIQTIAMGNPTQTTSNTRIYQIILQKFMQEKDGRLNWDKGWEILGRMAGNGGIFGESLPTRQSVILGQVAVAMTIDFYGVFAQRENPRTEYVIPTGGSIVNGDPVAFGVNMDSTAEAEAWVKFISSPEGQALWVRNDRLPVNPDAFRDPSVADRTDIELLYNRTLNNQGIAFNESLAQSIEFTMQEYFESSITDAHTQLKAAWSAMASDAVAGTITQAELDTKAAELFRPQLSIQEAIAKNQDLINKASYKNSRKAAWNTKAIDCYTGSLSGDICDISTTEFFLTSSATATSSDSQGTSTSDANITTTSGVTPTSETSVTDVPFSTISIVAAFLSMIAIIPQINKKRKI